MSETKKTPGGQPVPEKKVNTVPVGVIEDGATTATGFMSSLHGRVSKLETLLTTPEGLDELVTEIEKRLEERLGRRYSR